MPTKVLVTGASGFIAAHVIQQLIEQGYIVVGTVRSNAKGEFFKKQYGDKFQYEIVKDISVLNSFDHVFKAHPDIVYVQHTASPFHFKAKNPELDLLLPAINGTRSALLAAHKYGPNVKKVVVTSSFAAMTQIPDNTYDHSFTYNSSHWNPITYEEGKKNSVNGYVASKKLAETSAWDFVKEEKPKFAITTIQIPNVYGPPINDVTPKSLGTTNGSFYKLMTQDRHKNSKIPFMFPFYVDVRDVATAHVRAMTATGLDGKRSFNMAGYAPPQRILDTLRKFYPELDATLPIGTPGSYSEAKFAKFDVSDSQKYLHIDYIPFEKTVMDTYNAIRELEKKESAKL